MGSRLLFLKLAMLKALVATSIVATQSCTDIDDCFRGTGSRQTETRYTEAFDRIYLTDNIDLRIHIGQDHQLDLSGGDRLLPQVETQVENGTLRISNGNRCNWTRDFKERIVIDAYTPALKAIYLEDAIGNVTFMDTVHSDVFRLDSFSSMGTYQLLLNCTTATLAIHNGSADLKVSGLVRNQYGYSAGYGKFDAGNLATHFAYITNKGTNNIIVNPVNLLDALIEESGNIYYSGQPDSIRFRNSGTGKLINL